MGQQGDIWNTLKMLTVSDPTHMGSVLTVSETTEQSPHPILTMETETQSCPELPGVARSCPEWSWDSTMYVEPSSEQVQLHWLGLLESKAVRQMSTPLPCVL